MRDSKLKYIALLMIILFIGSYTQTISSKNDFSEHIYSTNQNINLFYKNSQFYSNQMNVDLDITMQLLLSSSSWNIDQKYALAQYLSSLCGHDLPLIYLISNEIAEIYGGHIEPFHQGFLISIQDEWAVFIEHGYYMTFDSKTSLTLISQLSTNYSSVLLASCYSKRFASNFHNVFGFNREITAFEIISQLRDLQVYNEEEMDIFLDNEISAYTLDVWAQSEFYVSQDIRGGLNTINQLNNPYYSVLHLDYVDLEEGGFRWGVTHINEDHSESMYYDNRMLQEILDGYQWFKFKVPGLDWQWKLCAWKFTPRETLLGKTFVVAGVLIGLRGNPIRLGEYRCHTIRTVIAIKLKDITVVASLLALSTLRKYLRRLEGHATGNEAGINRKYIDERRGYPYTMGQLNAPYIIANSDPEPTPGSSDPYSELAQDIVDKGIFVFLGEGIVSAWNYMTE